MAGLAVNGILAALTLLVFAHPFAGLVGYYWLSFFAPGSWAFGLLPWAPVLAGLTIVMALVAGEPRKVPINAVTVTLIAFFLWTTLTLQFAMHPVEGARKWEMFAKTVLIAFVTMALCERRERIHAIVCLLALAMLPYIVKGTLFVIVSGGSTWVRGPSGTRFYDNNGMARMVVLLIPLVLYLAHHTAHRWVRLALWAAIPACLLALIGTNSRGGFVAFVAAAGAYWLNSRHKMKLAAGGIAVLALGLLALPEDRLERWTSRIDSIDQYETDNSAQGRFASWNYAMDIARGNLFGHGFEAFLTPVHETADPAKLKARAAHSNYFEILGEHGYIGLGLYLTLVVAALLMTISTIRKAGTREDLYWARDLAAALQYAQAGYLAGGLTINHSTLEFYYTLVALTVATHAVVRRELAVPAPAAAPTAAEPTAPRSIFTRPPLETR